MKIDDFSKNHGTSLPFLNNGRVRKSLFSDLIVADYFSSAGALAADRLGVPCVQNIPGMAFDYANAGWIIPFESR